MNELELYVDSLDPSLSNEEKVRLVQEWKKANRWKEQEVEVSEEVELEEVDLGTVKKKDGVAGADAPSVSAAPDDTDLTLEDGSLELVIPEEELLKINEKVNSIDLNPYVKTKRLGSQYRTVAFDVDIVPYEEQRTEAENILKEQGVELNEQAIQDQMRTLIVEKEKDKYRAKEHDKNAPSVLSFDTVKKITSTVGNIFSGGLRGKSFANKFAMRVFYPEELNKIESQYAKDATAEAKAVDDFIDNTNIGKIKDVAGQILLPTYSTAKTAYEGLTGEDVDELALDIADKTDEYVEKLDKEIFKYEEDVATAFGDAIKQGDFSGFINATQQATREAIGSIPYMAVAAIPGGLGVIGVSTAAGGEFKENEEASKAFNELINLRITDPDYETKKKELEEKIRNGEINLQNLAHHSIVGITNSVFERFSGGLAKNFFNALKGKSKDVITKNLTQYVLGFVKDAGGEGLTESTQTAIEKASEFLVQGKEVEFQDAMKEVISSGIIGTVSGAGPSGATNSINIIKTGINNKKQQNLVKEAKVNNAVELFESDDIKPQGLDFTSIPGSKIKIDAELDLQVSNGEKTIEEANTVKKKYREVEGAVNKLKPLNISIENQPALVDLMIEQKNLKNTIKQVDNSSLTKAESARLAEIDTELGNLITKDKAQKIDIGAKKIAEEIGVGFESFDTQEDVDSAIATLQEEGGKIDTKNSDNYGTFVVLPDGRRIIILNKETATEDRTFTEGQHETAHAITYETVKNNPQAAIALGQALLNEIRTNKDINIKPGFQARLDQYIQDADISQADTMEEVMTLVSDGLTDGTIEINETIGVKLGNFIRRALSAMGMKVKFKNGKDVLNFIKDYNRSVHRQKGLSRGLKKTAIEGAEVKITPEIDIETEIKESVAKESKRVEDSQEVQKIYNEQGTAGAMDIIAKFKPITNKIVEARSQAPNFDRQLLTDEIETGKRGILDLVMEYKPESGVPLAAYINKFLPARAIEASKRVLGEEFTTDVTEARGVVAEEVTETTVEEKPIAKKPTETVEFSQTQIEKIGAKDKAEVETRITEATNEAFKGQDVKTFGQTRNVPKAVANIYADMFGLNPQTITDKTRNYQKTDAEGLTTAKQFLLKNAANDFSRLPETKDGFGKGTFLPRNVMNALYKDGKLTGTLKDYMDLIRQKPTKPIYRDAVGQTIRGLLNLHIRNRMFETLVPTTAERAVGGAKFSKRINTEEQIIKNKKLDDLFKEVAQAKSIIDVGKIIGIKGKITVNDSNRAQKQEQMLDFIKTGNIPSSVFEMAKFQNFARRKVDGVYVNLPARGGLYYGKSDPAYQTALDAAKENDSKYPDLAIPKRVNVNKAFTEKGINQSKENAKFFNSFVNILNDAVNKNGLPIEIAALYITSGYQATTGIIKIAAPFKYKSTKFEYAGKDASKASDNKGEKFREEHTIPASVIGANLILAIQKNAVKPVMKAIEDNYFQVQLSKKDDTKLDKANLDSTLFEGQTIFNNPISRLAGANINLQTIVNPLNGKTIAEENGVGINSKIYNNLNTDGKIQASAIQNEQIIQGLSNPELNVKEFIDLLVPLAEGKSKESKRLNNDLSPNSLKYDTFTPIEKVITDLGTADKALNNGRKLDPTIKKIRVFDFDDTLARSKSKVIVNMPDGSTKKINATQFAEQASTLQSEGAEFDFTEFEQVIDGKKGPLFNVAKKIAETRGTEDLFILTARPQAAAGPIKAFMKALGINIPLKNITGLGDGTAAAKGRWIASKAAEGYNDFYFADDATKNVKAVKEVLDQIDVKSRVQIAKASKRKMFDTVVNDMIESSSGVESYKKFSAAKARTIGRDKGRFDFITLASSAEDFKGLLYRLIGDGKKGEAQYEFLKTNLIDPYNRAEDAIVQAKISAANDFMALKEQFKGLPKTLETETGVGKFTYQHALRVYMWTKQDMSIPGLSKADARKLNKFITDDAQLQAFADQLISIQKGKPYPEPGKDWLGGNLTTDIIGGINKVNRAEYQQQWRENVEIIFSPENLNKMEAAYGTRWRNALENSLKRMKAGTNRLGYNDATSAVLDWVNNSVGAVMFLNTRSAVLQTISAVNFINWGDNNIIKAGAAFANQKQFWSDFMTLMNSDYLTQRRNGLKINVSESEIADAVKDSKNKVKAAIAYLLSKGFVFTRYADSFAIASGGATFYRNRIKKYLKEGMSQELAQEKAFNDFRDVAEESQQSSSPDKISMQQASAAGRVILNWANTPMQYVRIQKRALQDLVAGRGDAKVHISRIAYYGVMQNLIFNALQQALFAIGFGDDDEEDEKKKKAKDKKIARVANGMIDSQLKGLGIAGAAMVAAKNTLMKIYEESEKKTPEFEKAAIEALSFSPAISSKYRKIVGGLKSFSWNRKEIKEKGFSLDNPAYLAGAQIVTAFTNIPLDRVVKKINNIRGIMSEQSQIWQKVSMSLGWSAYDVGLPYYGGWDKPKEPTEAERKQQEIDVMKRDTNTAEQTQMLLDLGLDKKQIKALRYEDARVKKIIELQNKKKNAGSQK